MLGANTANSGTSMGTVIPSITPTSFNIKGSAGRLYSISVGNPNTSAVYLKMFNASAITLGVTNANLNYMIPASSTITITFGDMGNYFSTAINGAVTGAQAINDGTAITTACAVSYVYI